VGCALTNTRIGISPPSRPVFCHYLNFILTSFINVSKLRSFEDDEAKRLTRAPLRVLSHNTASVTVDIAVAIL